MRNLSCSDFINKLASNEPVPGGGGASALTAAIGVGLGNMVGSLTVGKKKYADVEERIIQLKKRSDELQERLLDLINEDAKQFKPLSDAYRLPSETDEEKTYKEAQMKICLKMACSVPIEIMELCCEGIDIVSEFAKKGSKLAVSDAGVGASFLRASLIGASMNVFINTKLMKDRDDADELNKKAEDMLEKYVKLADEIIEDVMSSLKI